MNIFFTADTHFGHANIIVHSKRPFKHVDEMDEALIERWNAVVQPNDEVWHLGDFNFKSSKPTSYYVGRLRGRIHIVWGNHDDKDAKRYHKMLGAASAFKSAQEVKYLRHDDEKITLYHYAQRVWRNSHHGSYHLYGHSHGSLEKCAWGRSMDVGVDCNNYAPVSWDDVKMKLQDRQVTLHHPGIRTDDDADET